MARTSLANFLIAHNYDNVANGQPISDIDVPEAQICLRYDQDSYIVNALISFSACVNSIMSNNYSWAFVESYYSVFYLAKCLLAERGKYVFYLGTKGFSIKVEKGGTFKKEKGNSHSIVLRLFNEEFNNDTRICGTIDNKPVVDWMSTKREEINYRLCPMTDPVPPTPLFRYDGKLRGWIRTYLNDDVYVYTSEHMYISYPLHLMKNIVQIYKDNSRTIKIQDKSFLKHLRKSFKDSNGTFDMLLNSFTSILNVK